VLIGLLNVTIISGDAAAAAAQQFALPSRLTHTDSGVSAGTVL
jgi:hypothetical protein